jgi:hypothetical protein
MENSKRVDAVEVKVAASEGKITDQREFVDYGERRAYADLIVKLGGHFVPTSRIESQRPPVEDVCEELIRMLDARARASGEPGA